MPSERGFGTSNIELPPSCAAGTCSSDCAPLPAGDLCCCRNLAMRPLRSSLAARASRGSVVDLCAASSCPAAHFAPTSLYGPNTFNTRGGFLGQRKVQPCKESQRNVRDDSRLRNKARSEIGLQAKAGTAIRALAGLMCRRAPRASKV